LGGVALSAFGHRKLLQRGRAGAATGAACLAYALRRVLAGVTLTAWAVDFAILAELVVAITHHHGDRRQQERR